MKEIELKSKMQVFESYDSFNALHKELFTATKSIAKTAYAPYSRFKVGAAILLDDNTIVPGNNQENASYPSGLCAERVAMFSASSHYPDRTFKAIALTIDYDSIESVDLVFPCGSCRQVMVEYEQKFKNKLDIFVLGPGEKLGKFVGIDQLMPFIFSSDILNKVL